MTPLDYEALSKEDKAAIAEYYKKQNQDVILLISKRIADYNLNQDQIGFMFLADIVRALLLRGADHLSGDVKNMPKTVMGWPTNI